MKLPSLAMPRFAWLCILALSICATLVGAADEPSHRAAPENKSAAEHTAGSRKAPSPDTVLDIHLMQSALGDTNYLSQGIRYFVTQIGGTNRTEQAFEVPIEDIRLLVDKQEFTPQFQPAALQNYSFESGTDTLRFQDLPQLSRLSVPPGETNSTWVIFTGLPRSGDVPEMVLEIPSPRQPLKIRVNEVHRDKLQLTRRRIGPKGALGLLTIAGSLDTVNVGVLSKELNQLSNEGVSRVVLSFADSAAPLPRMLRSWLDQAVKDQEQSRAESPFPAISAQLDELHLASLPDRERYSSAVHKGRPHIHRSVDQAVEWALEPVFRNLPEEEIVEQIEEGDPLVRAAALATGGRQLSPRQLPLILRLADDEDPVLRRGAFLALSEFGQPQAIGRLVSAAQGNSEVWATLAVECLAASRFQPAHEALERLLHAPLRVPLDELTRILAQYPRALWVDFLARLASGDWREPGASAEQQAKVRQDALVALGRIGHPELVGLLAEALTTDDESLRTTAFLLLVDRTDEVSERTAVDYALDLTRHTFPTQQILNLFDRTHDPRAVPLLIKHLESPQQDRSLILNTLAKIGPATIDQEFVERFDDLKPSEQGTALACLTQLGSPHAFALAKQGVTSEESPVFNESVASLQQLASTEAVAVLSDVLLAVSQSAKVNPLVRALGEIGTNEALNAMRRAMYAGDEFKEGQISERLEDLRRRSPGIQALAVAAQHTQNEQWQDAVEAYSLAIELDPELSEARSGRGHCRLHLDQLAQAAEDFRRALDFNPFDHMAVTGLGIVMVREGEVERGRQLVQEAADRFPRDAYFAYNSACVYGRSIETLQSEPESPQRNARINELQEQALTLLRLAAEREFQEFDYMRRDPDLAVLRELAEFQEIGKPLPGEGNR